MITEVLTLFDALPAPAVTASPFRQDRCLWHGGEQTNRPKATHRLVRAVDLMHPRWWRNGLRDDGGLRACDGGRVRLYVVGAGICAACVAECDEDPDPDPYDRRYGVVTHFMPMAGEA